MIISCIQLLSNKLLEAEHHEININEIFCGGICSIIKLYCICNTTLERIWRYICNVSGSILVTWMMLHMTHMWLISIIVGFLSWFISAVCIFEAVEFIAQKRLEKHSWKAGKSNSK